MNKIIKQMNNLYVLKRKKFLLMINDGDYITIQYNGKKKNQILDWRIKNHLNGKETIGVFSGNIFTKFICFDVDVKNQRLAKWTVYKLVDSLTRIGIPDDYIYISYSGSKGYHVEIFFNDVVHIKDIKRFYLLVMNEANLLNYKYGQVELRPTDSQGVKIPLGLHMKTKKICWYCDFENELKPIKRYDYILTIKQLDSKYFYDLINEEDFDISEKQAGEFEDVVENHTPLKIYKQNIDESYTLQDVSQLYKKGLTTIGSRHNSLLKLAKFFKHHGLESNETKEELIKWMKWQDKKYYKSKWDDVLKDIDKICDPKYYDKYTLTIRNVNIEVNKSEIEEILKIKSKNEKLLLYSMLIHSKRYSNMNGVFYMTYKQMQDVTGLSERTVIRLVKKLEKLKYIDVYRDNNITYDKLTNKPKSKPNKYIIKNLLSVKNNINEKSLKICDKNCKCCFNASLCKLYSDKEIRKIVSRNQAENIIKFKDKEYNLLSCVNK